MSAPPIEFPLSLRPVVRSREAGSREGGHVPYHAAIWIVDRTGRRILDVAPDVDDVRGGRLRDDPLDLVSRASRVVEWLQSLDVRLGSWVDLSPAPKGLALRPILAVVRQGRSVEAGVQFCSDFDEEFDRVTTEVRILARDAELDGLLEPLRSQVIRRFDAASSVLARLQEAVESWRTTEQLASSGQQPLEIGDGSLEQ